MLLKEYRICLPMTMAEYRIGQLYMTAKHCLEESGDGEGVEVVKNEPIQDAKYGRGQYTEKRIYLTKRLPAFAKSVIPKFFYLVEKGWNYFPYTVTELSCSFLPKFSVVIETIYEENRGDSNNSLGLSAKLLQKRDVIFIDIANDELPPKQYKAAEDPRLFHSKKTGRGPLKGKWMDTYEPVMCAYKVVKAKFEVWGLQNKIENFTQKVIRDLMLLGHRQAFVWIDEWYGMTMKDVREYEDNIHAATNLKLGLIPSNANLSEARRGSNFSRIANVNIGTLQFIEDKCSIKPTKSEHNRTMLPISCDAEDLEEADSEGRPLPHHVRSGEIYYPANHEHKLNAENGVIGIQSRTETQLRNADDPIVLLDNTDSVYYLAKENVSEVTLGNANAIAAHYGSANPNPNAGNARGVLQDKILPVPLAGSKDTTDQLSPRAAHLNLANLSSADT